MERFDEKGNHALNVHEKLHEKIRDQYTCSFCKKIFARKGNVKKHIEAVHSKLRKYRCNICELIIELITDNTPLRNHILRHKNDTRSFQCATCEKAFKLEVDLKGHIKVTHEESKVTCDVCNKMMKKNSLKSHMKSHTKSSEINCEECDKVFEKVEYLKKHRLLHSTDKSERQYSCNECDKSYHRMEYLRKHIRYIHVKIESGIVLFAISIFRSLELFLSIRKLTTRRNMNVTIVVKNSPIKLS